MKAQFKYAFMTAIASRGAAFAVIFLMDAVFIILGSLGHLPFAAHVTAVSLGGTAIAVMMAFNIISDIAVSRRMFQAPEAYIYMLTPAPRRQILFASVITMAVLDIFTMTVVITAQVWLSLNLAGQEIWQIFRHGVIEYSSEILYGLSFIPLLISCYLLLLLIILFSATAKRSILYKIPASGLLAILLAFACVYAASLLQLLLAPFGSVDRYGLLIIISLGSAAGKTVVPLYALFILLQAAVLFVITSKLMERKLNI